jgi:hypothetical protein
MYRDQSSSAVPACRLVQHISAFPESTPNFAIFSDRPLQTNTLGHLAQSDIVEIAHLRMAGLNAPESPLHLMAVLQTARLDGFR